MCTAEGFLIKYKRIAFDIGIAGIAFIFIEFGIIDKAVSESGIVLCTVECPVGNDISVVHAGYEISHFTVIFKFDIGIDDALDILDMNA